jgi:hypothetical protein
MQASFNRTLRLGGKGQGEGEQKVKTIVIPDKAPISSTIPPSSLVGEGTPKGRMTGTLNNHLGFLVGKSPLIRRLATPSPARGEGEIRIGVLDTI